MQPNGDKVGIGILLVGSAAHKDRIRWRSLFTDSVWLRNKEVIFYDPTITDCAADDNDSSCGISCICDDQPEDDEALLQFDRLRDADIVLFFLGPAMEAYEIVLLGIALESVGSKELVVCTTEEVDPNGPVQTLCARYGVPCCNTDMRLDVLLSGIVIKVRNDRKEAAERATRRNIDSVLPR